MTADDLFRGYLIMREIPGSLPSSDPVARSGEICAKCGSTLGSKEVSKPGVAKPDPGRANDWMRVCASDSCNAPWKQGLTAVVWRGEIQEAPKRTTMEDRIDGVVEHLRRIRPFIEEVPKETEDFRWVEELYAWRDTIHPELGLNLDNRLSKFRIQFGFDHHLSEARTYKKAVRHARGVVQRRIDRQWGQQWIPDATRAFLARVNS